MKKEPRLSSCLSIYSTDILHQALMIFSLSFSFFFCFDFCFSPLLRRNVPATGNPVIGCFLSFFVPIFSLLFSFFKFFLEIVASPSHMVSLFHAKCCFPPFFSFFFFVSFLFQSCQSNVPDSPPSFLFSKPIFSGL